MSRAIAKLNRFATAQFSWTSILNFPLLVLLTRFLSSGEGRFIVPSVPLVSSAETNGTSDAALLF